MKFCLNQMKTDRSSIFFLLRYTSSPILTKTKKVKIEEYKELGICWTTPSKFSYKFGIHHASEKLFLPTDELKDEERPHCNIISAQAQLKFKFSFYTAQFLGQATGG